MHHAIDPRIQAVARLAVGLGRHVDRHRVSSDQAALGRRLDRHFRQLLRRVAPLEIAPRHDLSVGDRLAAGRDDPVDAGQFGALFDEGHAAGRAGLAEDGKTLPYRPAAAGDHQAPFRVGIDVDDPHLVPVGLELVGDDAGERGADMLAHLGADDVDGHDAAAIDAVPDCRLEEFGRGGLGLASGGGWQLHGGEAGPAESQHRAGPHHRDQEAAARRQGGAVAAIARVQDPIHWRLSLAGATPPA